MTTASTAKKDTQKLQRAIVDGLEDVKGQDIRVFNTEHLSPLFERVVVASGTSNRQTRALASSVRDAVREAGFPKPRIEGEENGEWIIVDCGSAVAHIMQPAIRQYYNLEEIWGDKPVRLKGPEVRKSARAAEAPAASGRVAAKKPAAPAAETPARKTAATRPTKARTAAAAPGRDAEVKAPARKKPAAKAAPAKPAATVTRAAKAAPAPSRPTKAAAAPSRAPAAKKAPAVKKAPAAKAAAAPAARRSPAPKAAGTARKKPAA